MACDAYEVVGLSGSRAMGDSALEPGDPCARLVEQVESRTGDAVRARGLEGAAERTLGALIGQAHAKRFAGLDGQCAPVRCDGAVEIIAPARSGKRPGGF